jgi:transcriptional regulator with XRE-family HTH domain
MRVPDAQDEPAPDASAAAGVIDEWVAWNIRLRREGLGWSQADLAQKMAASGWKWHPQTVHRAEQGQRKVTIGEAEALARLFAVTVDALTWPDMVTHTSAWLGLFTARADAAFEQIAAQARELLFDREHLERALAEIGRRGMAGHEDVQGPAAEARSVLEDATPEQAVEAGRGQYGQWRATAPDDAWEVTGRDRFPRAPWLEGSNES